MNSLRRAFEFVVPHSIKHVYMIDGKETISVTNLTKQIEPLFDKDTISRRAARREGKTPEEVMEGWGDGQEARDLGTEMHKVIELVLNNIDDPLVWTAIEARFLPAAKAFKEWWSKLDYPKLVASELIVGDRQFGVGGKLDALIMVKCGDKYHLYIIDWKTGKLSVRPFNELDCLLPPFGHVSHTKLNVYSVQVSMYRLMLERNTKLTIERCYIGWFRPSESGGGFSLVPAHDFRKEALEWLKDGVPDQFLSDWASNEYAEELAGKMASIDRGLLLDTSPLVRAKLSQATVSLTRVLNEIK